MRTHDQVLRVVALLAVLSLAGCRRGSTESLSPPGAAPPLAAPGEQMASADGMEAVATAPRAMEEEMAGSGVVLARFRCTSVASPFDAGRIVGLGRTDLGFVFATVEDVGRPSRMTRYWVARTGDYAVATGGTTDAVDPALAFVRGLGTNGYELGWLTARPQGVELGRINFDGVEEREWLDIADVASVGAGWGGATPVVCGVRADGSVGCTALPDAEPAEEARRLDGTGVSLLGPGAVDCAIGGVEGSGEAPGPGCDWEVVGAPHVLGGEDSVVLVVLGRRGEETRPLARVVGLDGRPRGPVVDLAGEAWTPRSEAWRTQVQAVVIGDELAWVLPSGVDAMARAGWASLATGRSSRLQVEPLASMRERPLLFASNGAALFVYDAVGRSGERTMIRWRDGAPVRLEGLTPLGDGPEGASARLAAAGDGAVAMVVDDGSGGAEVVVVDADAFTRAN